VTDTNGTSQNKMQILPWPSVFCFGMVLVTVHNSSHQCRRVGERGIIEKIMKMIKFRNLYNGGTTKIIK
jgi:hypothetical protein